MEADVKDAFCLSLAFNGIRCEALFFCIEDEYD